MDAHNESVTVCRVHEFECPSRCEWCGEHSTVIVTLCDLFLCVDCSKVLLRDMTDAVDRANTIMIANRRF